MDMHESRLFEIVPDSVKTRRRRPNKKGKVLAVIYERIK
jgi:hypothetical protein